MSDDDALIEELRNLAKSKEFDEDHSDRLLEVAGRLEELNDEVDELNEAIKDAEREAEDAAFDIDYSYLLYEAIAEHRTQDAIDLLERAAGVRFIPAKIYASLFSQRMASNG